MEQLQDYVNQKQKLKAKNELELHKPKIDASFKSSLSLYC